MSTNGSPSEIAIAAIEKDVPFSQSLLWELQRTAYTQFGVQAWSKMGVPFYLTSNPHTAHQYAEVAIGYIQDCLKDKAKTPIDLSFPFYIFDLGAGTGRFAFLFLKHFMNSLNDLGINGLNICYVLTDLVQSNLDFCFSHPQMQPYIQNGTLDFALYDHSQSNNPLTLKIKNIELTSQNLQNPIILIANYFFDTIPQHLFKYHKRKLYEGYVTLKVPKSVVDLSRERIDPSWINYLTASYSYHPVDSDPYFENGFCNNIMEDYRKQFDGLPFLFPSGACLVLDYFSNLTNNRFLLLAGDQGVCTEDQVRRWGEPHLALHGSFSIAVSYHALQAYFNYAGGEALLTQQPDTVFVVMAGVCGGNCNSFRSMRHAFNNTMSAFGPSDYWKIINGVENECINPSLVHLLTLLKLGFWDPFNFNVFFNALRSHLSTAGTELREQLVHAINNVWDHFYSVSSEEAAFIMNLGVLLFEMQRYHEALLFFERARELGNSNPQIHQNIAACHQKLI